MEEFVTDNLDLEYKHYKGKILEVAHWYKKSSCNESVWESFYSDRIFEYTGVRENYCSLIKNKGPRLDVSIKVYNCPIFENFIEVNIYYEVMERLKYIRMSTKLYRSFETNEGRNIDIYVRDKNNIKIDITPLFNLNYGYKRYYI